MTDDRTLIDAPTLQALLAAGSVALFDCRFDLANPQAGEQQFMAARLPTAQYLHLERDLSGYPDGANGRHPLPDRQTLAATLRAKGVGRGQLVVAYDTAGGAYAARLWWLLRWLGHTDVAVLDGGLPAWQAAGLPLASGAPAPNREGDFTAAVAPACPVIETDAVLANLHTHAKLVLDARTPDRFRGEPNPLDPVAGHIPGARSRCFKDNLTPTGLFKPPHTLRAEFAAVLAGTPPEAVVLQCGSGVTACHNAFAMHIAGLAGATLYPGSWSAWIADPSRPVATGP
jgi:thiosulfate/3-mercaptopyruvate sulfurtransferase